MLALCIAACASNSPASSAKFPTKSITLIAPAEAGGLSDDALFVQRAWSKELGQNVVLRYETAGSGIQAVESLNQQSDAYSVAILGNEQVALTMYTQKTPLNLTTDLYPLLNFNTDASVIFVPTNSPYHSVSQLVAAAKRQKLSIGVAGVGSDNDLMLKVLMKLEGLDSQISDVPFNSGAELRTAVAGGHLAAGISPSQGLLGFAGELRPIGYFATKNPNPGLMPNVTSVSQQLGITIPNVLYSSGFWVSKAAETKDPQDVQFLIKTLEQTIQSSSVKAAIEKAGFAPYTDLTGSSGLTARMQTLNETLNQYGSLLR
jgi:tripartite-type tricarboxylate transporter receptor subunit TctC